LTGDYVAACRAEVVGAGLPAASSVYFGGGTPSLLDPTDLGAILRAIPVTANAEVTVECNPETVTVDRLHAYRGAGVTRLSFGVQSMVPSVLAALGRTHNPSSVHAAVVAAGEAGFARRYSVDLIYGAVGESRDDWRRTLEDVLALDPPPAHVSAYALTPEAGTPLGRDRARHPDPDDQADKYLEADRFLSGAGLGWYEVSNWAQPGAECRHNQLYWSQGDYRGIGCSAHSHQRGVGTGSRRWWNVRTPDRYVRLVTEGQSPVAAEEVLDENNRRGEKLELALRTRQGVPTDALADDPVLDSLVTRVGGRAVLTVQGRLLTNEVAVRLRT
jgi:oxygen-independent coproporphyrinogen-3 oxidase